MSAQTKTPHLLVIDDDARVLEVYRQAFAEEGYRVTTRAHPPVLPEVIALAPDAILLDLLIGPELGGWRLLTRLKAEPRTRDLPVVICTASALGEAVSEQLRAWRCAVVPKPFDLDELLAAVGSACATRAADRAPETAGAT